MKKQFLTIVFLFVVAITFSQTLDEKIERLSAQMAELQRQQVELQEEVNELKLVKIREDLVAVGLPELKKQEELITHSAMSLVYSEKHEQAKWVAHIILPDAINGKAGRSNDFREDPLIETGSATEKDYFIKQYNKETKKTDYIGFGYDRGHLAPSADFKWSKKALSETYFYSNMSPQLGSFNRKKWAQLERSIRSYLVKSSNTQLYVVTGPLLSDDLETIERSSNKISVPNYYFKVVLDLVNEKAIGFVMPNKALKKSISSFAVSINEVEALTGINFFSKIEDGLEERLEGQNNSEDWILQKGKR